MIQRIASSRSRSRCYTKSWNNNRLEPAHVVGGLDNRGDVLPAQTSAQGRAADDGRSGSSDPAGSLRSANPTPTARAHVSRELCAYSIRPFDSRPYFVFIMYPFSLRRESFAGGGESGRVFVSLLPKTTEGAVP